jgi:glycosyltransferase involved in cell wall biosynthesis
VSGSGLRIGMDALTITARPAGVGRAARGYLLGLSELPGEHRIVAARPRGALLPSDLPRVEWIHAPLDIPDTPRALVWQHLTLPRALRARRVDVHFGSAFVLPLRPPGVPEVVVVHDAAWQRFPESKSRQFRAYMNRVVPRSVRRARLVVAVSEFTADEIRFLVPDLDPGRLRVVPLGLDERRIDAARSPRSPGGQPGGDPGVQAPYLLCVSNFDPRKNLVRLVAAWRRLRACGLPHALVLVGHPARAAELRSAVDAQPDEPLLTPGYVEDRRLDALYAHAALVVVPSLYEGYGFPVLEAYAMGAPVACARAGSLPEIADGIATLFDPLDESDIARAVSTALDVGAANVDRGRARAATQTMRSCARLLLDVLEEAAAGPRPSA